MLAGGGFDIAFGKSPTAGSGVALTLDALYNLGLVNINDGFMDPGGNVALPEGKNRNIQFLAGFKIFVSR